MSIWGRSRRPERSRNARYRQRTPSRSGSRQGLTETCGSRSSARTRSARSPRPGQSPSTQSRPRIASRSRSRRGPDGNLWFTEEAANKIGRITPGGTITDWALGCRDWPERLPVDDGDVRKPVVCRGDSGHSEHPVWRRFVGAAAWIPAPGGEHGPCFGSAARISESAAGSPRMRGTCRSQAACSRRALPASARAN